MKSFYKKMLMSLLVVLAAVIVIYYLGFAHYFSLENIQAKAAFLKLQVEKNYTGSAIVFIAFFTALIGFTLPVTGPMGIMGGFLFGFLPGVLYGMISVFIGTTTSFLIVRRAMNQVMRNQYGDQLTAFSDSIRKYGYTYLISLQLLTVIPYFVINTLAVLAGVPLWAFIWTTLAGSLPVVAIYTFAGQQLPKIQSWHDILSRDMLSILFVFAALSLLPMVVKKIRKTES